MTDQVTINAASLPNFKITLEDNARPSTRAEVTNPSILLANGQAVRPYFRTTDELTVAQRNITKCSFQTWSVPLSAFAGVNLGHIAAIEFDFVAAAGEPIYIDTLLLAKI